MTLTDKPTKTVIPLALTFFVGACATGDIGGPAFTLTPEARAKIASQLKIGDRRVIHRTTLACGRSCTYLWKGDVVIVAHKDSPVPGNICFTMDNTPGRCWYTFVDAIMPDQK